MLDVDKSIADLTESNLFNKIQSTASTYASSFKSKVRRTLHPSVMQEIFEKERMAALGGTSGIVVGLLL